MRLHVNFFYALMLILSYTISSNNTCSGKLQKRAIEFDEIADFADIVEPDLDDIKKSIEKVRNIDIELPKELTRRYTPLAENEVAIRQASYLQNTNPSRDETTTQYTIGRTQDDVNKILNFRMKQIKAASEYRSKRKSEIKKNPHKRLVNIPYDGGSYLGNLADATNDINLKMHNFAATMMVILTTKKSTTEVNLGPKITGGLIDIKTVPVSKTGEQIATKAVTRSVDEKLLQTFTTMIRSTAFASTLETPSIIGTITPSSAKTSISGSTLSSIPTTEQTKKNQSELSSSSSTTTPTPTSTTATATTQSNTNNPKTSHVHDYDDYPFLGADGFYSDTIESKRKRSKKNKKRSKRSVTLDTSINQFDDLLKVIPAQINNEHSSHIDVTTIKNKVKPTISTSHFASTKHVSTNRNTNKAMLPRQFKTIAAPIGLPTSSPCSTSSHQSVTTSAGSKPMKTNEKPMKDHVTHSTHSPLRTKETKMVFTAHSPKSNVHEDNSYNSHPYRWENDIIKELKVKYKKEALKAAAFITPIVFVDVTNSESTTSDSELETLDVVKKDVNSTSTKGTTVGLTMKVEGDNGKNVSVPICHGKECLAMNQSYMVYNDTAGDCNKEGGDDVGTGGYNIISNEELPTIAPNFACPVDINATITTSTTTNKSTKMPMSPCEPNEEEDVGDSCDMMAMPAEEKQPTCKKGKHKKTHHHAAKSDMSKDKKRQVLNSTPLVLNYPSTVNLVNPQQSADIQRVLGFLVSTQFTPQTQPNVRVTLSPNINSASQVSSNFNQMLSATTQSDKVKKSIGKDIVTSVIESLKVVDQKLADAVDPLHQAQEELDIAARCETTTQCNPSENGNLLNELNESEKAALQRLAIKIMANQKFKRDDVIPVLPVDQTDSRDVAKRADYDYADQDRVGRLQRDISVAQEIETLLAKIKKRKPNSRDKRFITKPGIIHVPTEDVDQKHDDFGEQQYTNYLYKDVDTKAKLTRSLGVINTRVKNEEKSEQIVDYHTPKKKTKPKKLWRKLFGFSNNRNNNRFLDRDIPNFQSTKNEFKVKKAYS